MKVLILNGSPRVDGNTSIAIEEIIKVFNKHDIDSEIINVGAMNIRGCLACGYCYSNDRCVIDDEVNKTLEKLNKCDGLILASPVYYASANGTLISFLDRLFYANHNDLRMKVGASIAIARRGGTSSTFDELNKYFTISGMPIVSSQYWNIAHGLNEGDINKDLEGLQIMRTLASNMVFLMKSIKLGLKEYSLPDKENKISTNFIM